MPTKSFPSTPGAATVIRILPVAEYVSSTATGVALRLPGTKAVLGSTVSVKVTPVASPPLAVMLTVYFIVSPGSAWRSLSLSMARESVLVAETVVAAGADGLTVRPGTLFTPIKRSRSPLLRAVIRRAAGDKEDCSTGAVLLRVDNPSFSLRAADVDSATPLRARTIASAIIAIRWVLVIVDVGAETLRARRDMGTSLIEKRLKIRAAPEGEKGLNSLG